MKIPRPTNELRCALPFARTEHLDLPGPLLVSIAELIEAAAAYGTARAARKAMERAA